MTQLDPSRRAFSIALSAQIVAQCEARRIPETFAQPNTARLLVSTLRISAAEANRRVRAAAAVGPRASMTGELLEPVRPVLAAAQRAGEVSPEQVQVIVRALESVDRPGFDPADIAAGEALLTSYATTFEPKVLGQLAAQVAAAIDPDGTPPDDQLNRDRRHFSMRSTRDGAYVGECRLTGVLGAKLTAVLGPLAKPRIDTTSGSDGAPAGTETAGLVCIDDRTRGQRMHDALEDVCDRLLRSGALPDTGGTPATVIVTVAVEDLVDRLGYGRTSDGTLLSTEQVLELAAEADVIPTVMNRAGAVLAQGRARRIATPSQTWALVARDSGCSFPACDRPPELCERHHVVPWIDGGLTNQRQSDPGLSMAPPSVRRPWLDSPDQPRWAAGMDAAGVGRPTSKTTGQHPYPARSALPTRSSRRRSATPRSGRCWPLMDVEMLTPGPQPSAISASGPDPERQPASGESVVLQPSTRAGGSFGQRIFACSGTRGGTGILDRRRLFHGRPDTPHSSKGFFLHA